MQQFVEKLLSENRSGFRKGHSCQGILMHLVDSKLRLEKPVEVVDFFTDLSKAFDCLSYKLVISILQAYSFDRTLCMSVANYFTSRQQRVKVGSAPSNWSYLSKGTPPASHFGPFISNVLSYDLLYLIADQYDICNYADDSSICCHGSNVDDVITNLEKASNLMLIWFKENYIQPNSDKSEFILFHNAAQSSDKSMKVGDTILEPLELVKLDRV